MVESSRHEFRSRRTSKFDVDLSSSSVEQDVIEDSMMKSEHSVTNDRAHKREVRFADLSVEVYSIFFFYFVPLHALLSISRFNQWCLTKSIKMFDITVKQT